ncbi:MAG: PD40 domain-containing protein [Candidatus Aminicenantes bacterium]|nr:PD40 domain-containing protein [Candidatus Aminicenantes bacterium]
MKKSIRIISLILFTATSIIAQQKDFPKLTGPYLGQKPPGMTLEIFAPGIISQAGLELHSCITISQDGKEIYFSRLVKETDQAKNVIMVVKYQHEQWVGPETAPFSGKYNDTNPSFSPDGRLYFSSNRPFEKGGKPKQDRDIWYLEKEGDRWSEPIHLEGPVNSNMNDDAVSVSSKGSMYFYRKLKKDEGWGEIFISHFIEGKWSKPTRLEAPINTESFESFPVVAPDENFLIFYRLDRLKGVGQYVCFRQSDGTWKAPINMSKTINVGAVAFSANFSPDGKYLFVLRRRNDAIIMSPEGFRDGIYWVDAKIIEELKPKELK